MKRNILIIGFAMVLTMGLMIASCVSTKVANKSGSQLWTQNCMRCHNSPPSSAFTNTQWSVISSHMRQRAMLTEAESKKILEFLQAGD